jgi:hypothetical protein
VAESRTCTVHVALLDEGIDAWRPVHAEKLSEGIFRILSVNTDPDNELWQFGGGSIVRCKRMKLSGGEELVAVELAK